MARLSLSLLGPFQATLDGEPVSGFPSAKVRALLAYLAVEADHAHPREVLAGLLWPDYPERSAHTNLSNALSSLRSILGDRAGTGDQASALTPRHQEHKADMRNRADTQVRPYLLVERETVQFNRDSDCWVDVWEFEDKLRVVSCESPDTQLATQNSQLETGLALYRGPFLEGFSLHDSPPFEQWALVMRERLQRQMLAALRQLAGHHESRGEVEQAVAYARRQLELDPSREEAHRDLMRLLALSGQRSAALAQYEACVRALKEELAVEPAPETVELYQAIRANRPLPSEGVAPAATVPAAPVLPRHNLPAQSTPFVGRESELADLSRLLADPQVRLVTVVGPGGCGKTRLALEAAARQVGRYEHGVWFAPLTALQSAEGVVPAVAGAVGFQFYRSGDPRQQLLDYLREKRMLLVLDNWEHLLEGANLVADLLAVAPGIQMLATSRARLNLQGEHAFHLEGMEYPHPSPGGRGAGGEGAMQYSAVQLFVQSARRIDPKGFPKPLGSAELDAVVRLCRLVEGMPLALVLAAAWVEMLSPAEIAAEVERSLDFLAAEWRDLPERQRSVRAVFDHSWRLLSEREQAIFAALAVFRGGFTREAAQQVAGADLHVLASLMNKSLLERDSSGRYDMHDLLRQYGEERLNGSPDGGRAVRDRHAAYYATALERWAAELKGPRQLAALAEMDVEIDNARAAWEWATAQAHVEKLTQGMEGLGRFYDWRGRHEEGEVTFQATADRLATAGGGLETAFTGRQRALAQLWAWQSRFGRAFGYTERARKVRQGLDLLERLESSGCDVRLERAFVLWQGGVVEGQSGSHREARWLLGHSLSLYRSMGARWETAGVQRDLGDTLQALGFYDQARLIQQEVLATRRELGDQHGIMDSLKTVGWLCYEQGDFFEAERLLRESLALARTMGLPLVVDVGMALLYDALEMQGRFSEAHSLAEEAQALYFERPYHTATYAYASEIGDIELHLGRYAEAWHQAQESLALARKTDSQMATGNDLLLLGRVAMVEGAYAEAGQYIREGLDVHEKLGLWALVIEALAELAGVAVLQGDLAAAQQHLGRALRMVTERRSFIVLLPALSFVARLLAEQGQAERAVEIYALASRYPYVANSRWYEDLVGRRIAEVAATLPPAVVAAAQERGRARDVWATAEELATELGG